MKRMTQAATLAVAILLAVGSSVAAPRLEITEAVFDFGYAPQNSKVSHVFWLHSVGDDSLKILKVTPG